MRAGALAGDGVDRVVLPGYGPATWRALAILHEGVGMPRELALASAVARGPAEDLGELAPPHMTGLGDRGDDLAPLAGRIHWLQAARQDHRHALLVREHAIGVALEAGNTRGVEALGAEHAETARIVALLDREIARGWWEGAGTPLRS